MVGTFLQPRQLRDARIATRRDEDAGRSILALVAHDGVCIAETGSPFDQLQTLHAAENIEVALLAEPGYHRFPMREKPLRIDGTVVETAIHYPTDSALLGDGVRVLSRLLKRAKTVLGKAAQTLGPEAFRSRVRTVRRLAQQLHRLARRKGAAAQEALKAAYRRLIDTAKRTGAQARRVLGYAPHHRVDWPAGR